MKSFNEKKITFYKSEIKKLQKKVEGFNNSIKLCEKQINEMEVEINANK